MRRTWRGGGITGCDGAFGSKRGEAASGRRRCFGLTCGDARFQGVMKALGDRGAAADGLVVPVGNGAYFPGGAGDEEFVGGAGFGFGDRALLGGDVELLRAIKTDGAGDAGEDFGA